MSPRQTKSSTPKLSELARHVRVPSGAVSTGWPAVRDRCKQFKIGFDPWQHGIGQIALAKRQDGSYAASVGGVVLSIPRQTGKTYLIGWLVFALCTLNPGLTVIWTAHHTRTSDETFGKMRAMAIKEDVRKHILGRPRAANGQQAINFRNGSRILFGAREQGFGRGFDKVDVLVLDEAQILTESAMGDMVPATNAAPNGLVFLMGTPPRPGKDPGEVFSSRRSDALDGDEDTALVEFSADPGARVIDWDQLAKANPSFPKRTNKTAILRMQKLLGSDDNFRREAYGIWDEAAGDEAIFSRSKWDEMRGETPTGGNVSYGVKFSPDNGRLALTVASTCDDGKVFVEVVDYSTTASGIGPGAAWLAERSRTCDAIVIDGQSHAGLLVEELLKRNVHPRKIVRPGADEVITGSARFFELFHANALRHSGQPGLANDIAGTAKRPIGRQGGWGFKSIKPDAHDVCVESAALAITGLKERPSVAPVEETPERPQRRKAMVM